MPTDQDHIDFLDHLIEESQGEVDTMQKQIATAKRVVETLQGSVQTLLDLRARFIEATKPEEPQPEPEPEPEPEPGPVVPVPAPSSYFGVGQDKYGRTMFAPNRTVTLRPDGTGDYATLDAVADAIREDPAIEMVLTSGSCRGFGKFNAMGQSRQRPVVFRGLTSDAKLEGLWSDQPIANLVLVDVACGAGTRFIDNPGENLLFEGVEFSDLGGDGLVIQGERIPGVGAKPDGRRWQGRIAARFCRFLRNWSAGGKCQGLFGWGMEDWSLEYCIFFGNGWEWNVPRDQSRPSGFDQLRSQNAYLAQPCGPGLVRNCIFAEPGGTGIQVRPGGDVIDNLFLNCPVGLGFGYHYPSDGGSGGHDYPQSGGLIKGNVQIGSVDVRDNNPRGFFLQLQHLRDVVIERNAALFNGTPDANNVWAWFDKGAFNEIVIADNFACEWGSSPYRFPERVQEFDDFNNRFNMQRSELADAAALLAMKERAYMMALLADPPTTKQDFEAIMSGAWAAIGV